ncbi:hypothetical protein BU23DRAFT_638997 [Bimuria novae-zelandiae CBS 107.79]|uniref:Uncharacterized protein n=1 Tax=Bimuria novae-zelandiae CBS 107.79 TaxID=1447943 RepID=A0A6A5VBT6_9PLEO|nr:hypothetical protein BU23DRAFT_638997 [Bimuria novae-zelandiae CBS 107.79]
MAFAAAMGVDFSISGITMAAALLPVEDMPVARIGIGSTELGAQKDARTNGVMPNLYLYDVRGKRFAKRGMFSSVEKSISGLSELTNGSRTESGDLIEDGVNEMKDFIILAGTEKTTKPEYLTIQARTNDAACVSCASGAKRIWHAGDVKTCEEQGGGGFYYPSPNTDPDTNFRPGCAPGRMSLYKIFDGERPECIPYYDKILERFKQDEVDEKKGINEGFDKDFQAVVDGHTLSLRNFFFKPSRKAISFEHTCDYSKYKLFNQEMEPGRTHVTDTPKARKHKEAAAAKAIEEADAAARAAAEEKTRQEAEAYWSEEGINPNGPPPGTRSFGGVAGLIPADQAGKPVDPEEAANNLEEFNEQQASNSNDAAPTITSITTSEPTGNPGAGPVIEISRRVKRSLQQEQQDEEAKATEKVLWRREQLRAQGNSCVDRLTISHHAEHSAREVCGMQYSWGPDFVSMVEGLYCVICERELYPLCAHERQLDCFDVDERVLRRKESLWQRVKRYVNVQV